MAKSKLKWLAWGGALSVLVIAGVLIFVLASRPIAHALQSLRVSPDPSNITDIRDGSTDTSFSHVLKREASSTTDVLEMKAYFSSPSPAEMIQIANRDTGVGLHCGVTGTSGQHIQVILRVQLTYAPAAPTYSTITYNVPYDQICSGPQTQTNASCGAGVNVTCNNANFFGYYQVPAAFTAALPADPETGLYPVGITIKYNSSTAIVPVGAADEQIVTFKIRLSACAVAGCTKYVSTSPAPTPGDSNYSILGRDTDSHHSRQSFGFGLPCTATSAQSMAVNLYDADNYNAWGGLPIGSVIFWIEYRQGTNPWQKMRLSAPGITVTQADLINGGWDARPDQASDLTATVQFSLQPRMNYRIVVDNVHSANLISVGLPTETIFGDIDCNANLDAAIVSNPAANPIEDGQIVSLTAQAIRGGTVDIDSVYNYTWSTWFDTGDGIQQPTEDQPCAPAARNNVIQSGTGTLDLEQCPNIQVSSARSGGRAVALCGRIVLERVDTFTNIGVGAAPNGYTRCINIGKYPHLEARNGDVFAGGQFASVQPTCNIGIKPIVASSRRQIPVGGAFYTSYATYGVTSLGSLTTFGSLGVSYDTSPTTIADNLVFANTSNIDGYFYNATGNNNTPTVPHCLNDPFMIFGPRATTNVAGTSIDISSLTTDTNLTSTSEINLYATAPIPAGKKIVIYARSANIKISSNILYANQLYSNINEIPQIVILTDRSIIVRDRAYNPPALSTGGKVTQLDGIYAAKTNLYTCDLIPRLHLCNAPLQINGAAVIGGNVVPLRTAGADSNDFGAMAETFNLRSDMFLNQLPEAGGSDVFIKTLSETEVPPRF